MCLEMLLSEFIKDVNHADAVFSNTLISFVSDRELNETKALKMINTALTSKGLEILPTNIEINNGEANINMRLVMLLSYNGSTFDLFAYS